MAKPTRIALDLTLLLDLAANDATALQGIDVAGKAFPRVEFVVSPVTQQALAHTVTATLYDAETRSLATAALVRIERQWKFVPRHLASADLGVCDENAKQLVALGLLGGHAWNSAYTVAEAACLDCSVLLCHDPELLQIEYLGLKKVLESFDRNALWITTPGELIRQSDPAASRR